MTQPLCVIEYWRGVVNMVHGPFTNQAAAEDYIAKRAPHLQDRGVLAETKLETRVLFGGGQ